MKSAKFANPSEAESVPPAKKSLGAELPNGSNGSLPNPEVKGSTLLSNDDPKVLAAGAVNGSGEGAGGAARGAFAVVLLGGAGRGGGCLLFFGGRAGVGLSDRGATGGGPNGSLPNRSPLEFYFIILTITEIASYIFDK